MTTTSEVIRELQPNRAITGISAVLLPYLSSSEVDWSGFEAHVQRTLDAGLRPAVNMDTGYVNLLDPSVRLEVLQRTQALTAGRPFCAGAFVGDAPGSSFSRDGYAAEMELIQRAGGTPVIFQSYGLTQQEDQAIIDSYRSLAECCDSLIGFELSQVFAPFGQIYSETVYRGLMEIPRCIGAKHSSLDRSLEWQRLNWRNQVRPDFMVLTGNDLAIDMVMYGSDYLLGLSSFAPDLFARRDRMWQQGDPDFYSLNDVLQYLGFFTFRAPVPAYKHSAAMFLRLRGMIATSLTHPQSAERPQADEAVLQEILNSLAPWL